MVRVARLHPATPPADERLAGELIVGADRKVRTILPIEGIGGALAAAAVRLHTARAFVRSLLGIRRAGSIGRPRTS